MVVYARSIGDLAIQAQLLRHDLNQLILRTPSSNKRNRLTEANICFYEVLSKLEEAEKE